MDKIFEICVSGEIFRLSPCNKIIVLKFNNNEDIAKKFWTRLYVTVWNVKLKLEVVDIATTHIPIEPN